MRDFGFGNFIYQCRAEKGLSQSELGELMGVTNKAVSKWESGASKPRTEDILKLSEILEVSVEEILLGKRITSNSEFEKIKSNLAFLHKTTALKASGSLALLLSLPLSFVFFVTTVMNLKIPDDIIGPLGAFLLIILFAVSITLG